MLTSISHSGLFSFFLEILVVAGRWDDRQDHQEQVDDVLKMLNEKPIKFVVYMGDLN